MLEIALGIGVCFLMGKMADMEGKSFAGWFGITFAIAVACLVIPLPFVRMMIPPVVVFILLMITKER